MLFIVIKGILIDGQPAVDCVINVVHVTGIQPFAGGSKVRFVDGSALDVEDTPQQLMAKIAAMADPGRVVRP